MYLSWALRYLSICCSVSIICGYVCIICGQGRSRCKKVAFLELYITTKVKDTRAGPQ